MEWVTISEGEHDVTKKMELEEGTLYCVETSRGVAICFVEKKKEK